MTSIKQMSFWKWLGLLLAGFFLATLLYGVIMLYMNYIEKHLKNANQSKTIGIIVCRKEDKYLIEYSSDDRIIIKRVGNDTFDYWEEVDKTHIYILFDKKYAFDTLPDGFKYIDGDRTCIDCCINYYKINNNKRIRSEVEHEIDAKSKILKDWVDSLPIYKER